MPIEHDVELHDNEIDNVLYLTFKYTVEWPMRQVDKAVVLQMTRSQLELEAENPLLFQHVSTMLEVACEYVWDHICGEPEEPSTKQLLDHIRPIIDNFFELPYEQRIEV